MPVGDAERNFNDDDFWPAINAGMLFILSRNLYYSVYTIAKGSFFHPRKGRGRGDTEQ